MLRQRRPERSLQRDRDVTSTSLNTPAPMVLAPVAAVDTALEHSLLHDTDVECGRRKPDLALGGNQRQKSSMYRRLVARSG